MCDLLLLLLLLCIHDTDRSHSNPEMEAEAGVFMGHLKRLRKAWKKRSVLLCLLVTGVL